MNDEWELNPVMVGLGLWVAALVVALIGCLVEGELVAFFVILVGWLVITALGVLIAASDW